MTIEEERLSEMLHRLTPEPPRAVTVEDVALCRKNHGLANQAAPRRDGHTAVLHLGKRGRMRWAPALAAASVIAVVGASAGIGVALTSHHSPTSPATGATNTAGGGYPTASTLPTVSPAQGGSTHPPEPRIPVANGMWGAVLINRDSFSSDTLVGGAGSLYAVTDGALVRIDPSSGNILQQVSVQTTARPVVAGNMVWVAEPDANGVTLHGYDAGTLSLVRTFSVPGGAGAWTREGILAAGPGGDLYVVTGNAVAAVDSASGSVKWRTPVTGGHADSVAITPDGGALYVGVSATGGFRLADYNPATGAEVSSTAIAGGVGGYLVATQGGVWGSAGLMMTQRVWFAPGGNMAKVRYITAGGDGGLDSAPAYTNGLVWVGGTRMLECLDPSSGQVLGSTSIPADGGVPEHFGSVAYTSGHAFALYLDQRAQLEGVAAVTPPSSCAG